MPARPPSAEDLALWRRVIRDVRPIGKAVPVNAEAEQSRAPAAVVANRRSPVAASPAVPRAVAAAGTLDGSWDRRLKRGIAAPDVTIDLHGHSLASAHRALIAALDRAVASEARLMLVITGKPPRGGGPRGAIRAAIGDWLMGSPHAGRIAALRNAHPRHGGEGALYLVLRSPAKGRKPIP